MALSVRVDSLPLRFAPAGNDALIVIPGPPERNPTEGPRHRRGNPDADDQKDEYVPTFFHG